MKNNLFFLREDMRLRIWEEVLNTKKEKQQGKVVKSTDHSQDWISQNHSGDTHDSVKPVDKYSSF